MAERKRTTRKPSAKTAGSVKRLPAKKVVSQKRPTKSRTEISQLGAPQVTARFVGLPDQVSQDFNGILTLLDDQASLSGTLLLFGDPSNVAAAIFAAAAALQRQNFHNQQPVVITGTTAVVHFNDHPLQVIVMTAAHSA